MGVGQRGGGIDLVSGLRGTYTHYTCQMGKGALALGLWRGKERLDRLGACTLYLILYLQEAHTHYIHAHTHSTDERQILRLELRLQLPWDDTAAGRRGWVWVCAEANHHLHECASRSLQDLSRVE